MQVLFSNYLALDRNRYSAYTNYKNSQNNVYSPTFGHKLPSKIFYDIKDLPKLKCACCGKDMFKADEIKTMLNSYQAGSKRALENNALAKFKDTEAFEFLSGLSKENPKATLRELVSTREGGAKMRDLHPRTQLDIMQMALIADGISVKAPRVIAKLSKYKDMFGEDLRAVYDTMEIYAEMYPKKTFAEIFNLPEVSERHKTLYAEAKAQTSKQKIDVFKRLRDFSETLPPKDRSRLQDANTQAIKILNNGMYEPKFVKALVSGIYENFLKSADTKRIRGKIMPVVNDFPYDLISPVDAFISNSIDKKRSDIDIIKIFLDDMMATFEHARPRSQDGSDEWFNGIVLCKHCNRTRADLPYPFFLSFYPEMKKNIQRQCDRIMTFIMRGKLKGHDDYPADIKRTMLVESGNVIRLNITKYLKYREQQTLLKLEQSKAILAQDEAKYKEASQELREVDSKIEEIMKVVRQLKKERRAASEKFNAVADLKNQSEGQVKDNEILLRNIREDMEIDSSLNKSVILKRIKKLQQNKN